MPFPRVRKPTGTAGSRIPKLNTTNAENQVINLWVGFINHWTFKVAAAARDLPVISRVLCVSSLFVRYRRKAPR